MIAVISITLFLLAGDSARESCAERASGISESNVALFINPMAKDSRMSFKADSADENLADCPQEEALWYFYLRRCELDRKSNTEASTRAFAKRALARFPRSARIATIYARLDKGIESAKAAVELDPNYPPALVALARALIAMGQPIEARAILEKIPELSRVDGGHATLAQSLFDIGDWQGAIAAAKREFIFERKIELTVINNNLEHGTEAEEIIGLASIELKQFESAVYHLLMASMSGREIAKRTLKTRAKEPAIRRALIKLSRDPKLEGYVREYAREFLK